MKHIRLLSTISILFFIYSCKSNNKAENKKSEKHNIAIKDSITNERMKLKNKQLFLQDSIDKAKEDSLIKVQQIQDSIALAEKKKKEELKVIIDGKVYYKKDKDDFRVSTKGFIFRTKDLRSDYDIRTGGYVPSGFYAGEED